jgi:peptide/nickel transport system ATP-binding protein
MTFAFDPSPTSLPPPLAAVSKVLQVASLSIAFPGSAGWRPAVKDVSFQVGRGELLALVGESGCGKSLTSLAVLGLLPGGAAIQAGSIQLLGQELTTLPHEAYRRLRGARMALIPQDPLTALNPVYCVGEQIAEVLRVHEGMTHAAARQRSIELLESVRIPNATARYGDYPHQFSGGMRQRVMIAMALGCTPDLLIADEPTTALDVTVQAQILDLLGTLRREQGMAILFITHDLGVVAEVADRVAVMYAGQLVETASVDALFKRPSHPYTQGLLGSIPKPSTAKGQLQAIAGQPPALGKALAGCGFASRCRQALERCVQEAPPLFAVQDSDTEHHARCWLAEPS